MVFWTVVFLSISLYGLIRGGIFKSMLSKIKEVELKRLNGGNEEECTKELTKAGCLPMVVGTSLMIAEVFYLFTAINVDTFKYPTIAAIFLIVAGFFNVKVKKNTKEMNENELTIYKAELLKPVKRTFLSVVRSLAWIVYFGYMFYLLVF